ncbi:NUDIX hydrolase [Streptomyces sp. TRM68367]|uniref:NUDIX hydrolase n=1 Tax=Streptomyces sp. TRM68367 TaxID=2758415 RepID=UPI00165BCB92|nr:NUDIX hydrolase [Streptomyces sp. TRM68367]MBC9724966.1 NUDIX hydrolase [Streptomyces sp. TRM68367]
MEVIDVWTGHRACMLQSALRLTNEAFADRLGISTRTVATWHSDPDVEPRSEMQQLLDAVFESAPATVRQRFTLLVVRPSSKSTEASGPQPQTLRVAIAVVVRDEEVLLVCRRGDDASGITWQFPAGVIKPGVRPETATVRETLDETGVHCAVRRSLGERLHPVTGVQCVYFLCEYLAGDATNSDVVENVDVTWVPKNAVGRFISADTIYPPILAALEEDA